MSALVECRSCRGSGRFRVGECCTCHGRGEIASDFARALTLGRVRRWRCDGCGRERMCAEHEGMRYCSACWTRRVHPELLPKVAEIDPAALPF